LLGPRCRGQTLSRAEAARRDLPDFDGLARTGNRCDPDNIGLFRRERGDASGFTPGPMCDGRAGRPLVENRQGRGAGGGHISAVVSYLPVFRRRMSPTPCSGFFNNGMVNKRSEPLAKQRAHAISRP